MTKTEQVVECVKANPGKTSWELARLLVWNNKTVNPALTHAHKKGYIRRERSEQGRYKNIGTWIYFAQ